MKELRVVFTTAADKSYRAQLTDAHGNKLAVEVALTPFLTEDDYEYWNLYHTTPKAFIRVEDAREMWGIVQGNTTLVS